MKKYHYLVIILLLFSTYVVIPLIRSPHAQVLPAHTQIAQQEKSIATTLPLGIQTKTQGCVASLGLPDTACTPGAVIPSATKEQICTPGYSKSVRNVPIQEKTMVFAEYGIQSHQPGEYEVDHLVSLELGGSNDIANLWPEAAVPTPGFHEKDQVENYLHTQLCTGAMTLQQVQQAIAANWLITYRNVPNLQQFNYHRTQ